jgi:hypothetical protein
MAKRHASTIGITTAALAAALLLGAQTGATAAECKGMEKAACERAAAQCSWVDPYTRKDGVKVNGHCRKKPAKKSGSSSG